MEQDGGAFFSLLNVPGLGETPLFVVVANMYFQFPVIRLTWNLGYHI